MATDLVSVFSGSVPFSQRFPLHIWENLSISSSILKTTSKHVQHVPYLMLFYVVLRYICISVPHTASTVPSFLFFTAQKINIMIYFYYTSLTGTTAIHCSMKNSFLLIDPFRKSPSCVEFIVFLSTSQKIESLTRSQNDSGIQIDSKSKSSQSSRNYSQTEFRLM